MNILYDTYKNEITAGPSNSFNLKPTVSSEIIIHCTEVKPSINVLIQEYLGPNIELDVAQRLCTLNYVVVDKPLTEAKLSLLTEIKTKADALSHELKAKYTIWEVDSWPEQEAHAHLVMQSEPIPENSILYTILAGKNKGLPVEQQLNLQQLAEKVRHNVAAARAAAKLILYQQNALEEAIKLALSVEELEGISIEYHL